MYTDYSDTPKRTELLQLRSEQLREQFADEYNIYIDAFLADVPTEVLEGWDDVNLFECFEDWVEQRKAGLN